MGTTNLIKTDDDGRAAAMWRCCLLSAIRTALACTIVGITTLFGPSFITRHVSFPAFSYVTAILIVTDATLGDTLHGFWLALCATVHGACPAILALWLISPAQLTTGTTAAAVALAAFVVALPESTHFVAKRIALGQIVITYVVAFARGVDADPIMLPVHVVASTALGTAACVLALLLPYPSLASYKVRENCRLYTENASRRLKLYMEAFTAQDKTMTKGLICQAKSLNSTAYKLLKSIISKQGSMKWERIIPVRFLKLNKQNPGHTLHGLETILRGMENALENFTEFPAALPNAELKNELTTLEEEIMSRITSMGIENSVHPQLDADGDSNKFFQTLQTNITLLKISRCDLPSLFFFFCLKNLLMKSEDVSPIISAKQVLLNSQEKKQWLLSKILSISSVVGINRSRLLPALKCSLSLGFAVLFGLIYSKEDGYWAGLPIAISLASAREATFTVANIKAQGTVLGSVYGVITCFFFQNYVKIRLISLLPWFIFSSFLRQSHMYGQAGGVCTLIGAVLILGRKNFGTPSDFAIVRIVETFIGLSCSIMVDILLCPTRAATLAKFELSMCLHALHECVASLTLGSFNKCSPEERFKKLKSHVQELGKFMEEAEAEPNFWFLPFNTTSYTKLKSSLMKMADLLLFVSFAIRQLQQELDSETLEGIGWNFGADLNLIKESISSRVKCLEEISRVKCVAELEREYDKKKTNLQDLESGTSGKANGIQIQWQGLQHDDSEEMIKKVTDPMLQHLGEINNENMDIMKDGVVVMSVSAVAFCMDGLLREIIDMEKGMGEIVQWENPSTLLIE